MDKVSEIFGKIWGVISGWLPSLGAMFDWVVHMSTTYPIGCAAFLLVLGATWFYRKYKPLSIFLIGLAIGAVVLQFMNGRS